MYNQIIQLYINYKKNNPDYDLDSLLNKTLYMYYDKSLDNLYKYIKKCLIVVLFLKDLDIILEKKSTKSSKSSKNNCFSKKNKKSFDLIINEFIKNNKLNNFIGDILKLYYKRNIINIEDIKKNVHSEYLFLIIKYENNNTYTNDIINMDIDDKLKLINNIITDIENI